MEIIFFIPSDSYLRGISRLFFLDNNNLRDFYFRDIVLGEQDEEIYEPTNNAEIAMAFREAGAAFCPISRKDIFRGCCINPFICIDNLFVIVEGPSDDEALGVILNRLYNKNVVHVEITHGDMTSAKNVKPENRQ